MALGDQVESSLIEAEGCLRNALAYAARCERPIVCKQIANLITEINSISSFDSILDTIEEHTNE